MSYLSCPSVIHFTSILNVYPLHSPFVGIQMCLYSPIAFIWLFSAEAAFRCEPFAGAHLGDKINGTRINQLWATNCYKVSLDMYLELRQSFRRSTVFFRVTDHLNKLAVKFERGKWALESNNSYTYISSTINCMK